MYVSGWYTDIPVDATHNVKTVEKKNLQWRERESNENGSSSVLCTTIII